MTNSSHQIQSSFESVSTYSYQWSPMTHAISAGEDTGTQSQKIEAVTSRSAANSQPKPVKPDAPAH
jgi:hypothetical protein